MLEDAVDDVERERGVFCDGGIGCAAAEGNGGPEVEVVEDVEAGCVWHYLDDDELIEVRRKDGMLNSEGKGKVYPAGPGKTYTMSIVKYTLTWSLG